MLNNILNNVENMMEQETQVTANDINEMGFVFIKSTDIISSCGYLIVCMTIAQFEEENIEAPVVIIDYNFEDLSKNAQAFMIYHELGHYKLQRDKIVSMTGVYRDINDEFEADEYAMKQLGHENAVAAMEEMLAMMDELSFGMNEIGMEEVRVRIENLNKKALVKA